MVSYVNSQPHGVHGAVTAMVSPGSMEQKPHQPAANFTFPKRKFGKNQDIRLVCWVDLATLCSKTDNTAYSLFVKKKADKAGKL